MSSQAADNQPAREHRSALTNRSIPMSFRAHRANTPRRTPSIGRLFLIWSVHPNEERGRKRGCFYWQGNVRIDNPTLHSCRAGIPLV